MQQPGDDMTIEATRIIDTGEEINLFSEKIYYFGYSVKTQG